METKRKRQLINRADGYSGSFMPIERAQSIARRANLNPKDNNVIQEIRLDDRLLRCNKFN